METNPIFFSVFTVVGSLTDLSPLDFSVKNIKCLNLADPELKKMSDTYKPANEGTHSLYETIIRGAEKIVDEQKYIHVFLPINFLQPPVGTDYIDCINVIKLIYPSDIQYCSIAVFSLYEDQQIEWMASNTYNFYPSGSERYDNYLCYPFEKDIDQINKFIQLLFERINNLNYVQVALDAYLTSFNDMPNHMAFISLCMSLETVVGGTAELTYRIARSVSLICADNQLYGRRIFENVNLIYALRSKIVHGGAIKNQLVDKYLPYLRSLVSRMITQLIYLNQPVIELQNSLLFADFSIRNALFGDQKNILNTFTYTDTLKSLK